MTDYCKKGSKIYLVGALQTRKWSDQSGAERYSTEVVLQKFRGELQLLDAHGGGKGGSDRDGHRQRQADPIDDPV